MNFHSKQLIWQDTSYVNDLLRSAGKQIVILIHVNPDGDAIGSSLGLLKLLANMGHSVSVISPNDFPGFLKWMPGSEQIVILKHNHSRALDLLQKADILYTIDFNELKRVRELRDAFASAKSYKVLIDHHPDVGLRADCILSDTSVSSTAELVYDYIIQSDLLRWFDKDIAACLFTGIMTDTGCFSYNSSQMKTWETVADLLSYGIDKDHIYSLIYDNFSTSRMRLLGYCLNEKMEILPEYHTGYIWLTKADLLNYQFQTGDTEGFVNYPLSIKGIRFSAMFVENDNHIRISFRSKGNFPVNEFAKKHFNGGGHANASGAESELSLDETIRSFREALPIYKDKLINDEI
jgi:bifunctional oligoribonuclease and PAP phosphatase NrnA